MKALPCPTTRPRSVQILNSKERRVPGVVRDRNYRLTRGRVHRERLTSVRQLRPTNSLALACPINSMVPVSRRSFVWWQPHGSTPLERVFQFAHRAAPLIMEEDHSSNDSEAGIEFRRKSHSETKT